MASKARLLATVLALSLCAAPALAQMSSLPSEPQREAPVTPLDPPAPARPAPPQMDFRIVEGRGVFGLSRWVQASGPITDETPDRFEAFARDNPLEGMTVVLDSPGGSLQGGVRLGRALRAARVNTTVGRTFVRLEGDRTEARLVTHGINCASACSYALLGGVARNVAPSAVVAVHQFSRPLNADGGYVRETPTVEEFQRAQWITAQLALYLQEMGVNMQLLVTASNHPFGQQLYALTPDDLQRTSAAVPAHPTEAEIGPLGWSAHPRSDAPMLYRRLVRSEAADRRVDEEVFLTCHNDAEIVALRTRIILSRGDTPFSLTGLRVGLAGRQVSWTAEAGTPLRAEGVNGSVWVTVNVPRDALSEAARTGRLTVELIVEGEPPGQSEISADLGAALPGFMSDCDAARARSTARAG